MTEVSAVTASSPPTLSFIAYDAFLGDVEAVAVALEQGDWRPDFLVGIGRGGLVPAAYLSHRTNIPMLSVDHSSKVFGFADELLMKLGQQCASGQRILFVDDINDSGTTMAYLRETIVANGAVPDNVRFAVLINNSRSIAKVDYWSRMIDRATDKDWFVFPWESVAPRVSLIEEAESMPERLA